MKNFIIALASVLIVSACDNSGDAEFTGNQISYQLIPGNVQGNETTGTLLIRERTGGVAQIEITLNGVFNNANHPAHLHYGSLEDNGSIATMLNPVVEVDGVGQSITLLTKLENGESITYSDLLVFNGSVKIHFEASGPMKDEILGATNIGINGTQNQSYLNGDRSITLCNSEF
jgi:hypothetical protein